MVVTIDGPAGAGKSTVSRLLARRLGFAYLDTGALYRAVALAASWDRVKDDDLPVVAAWLTRIGLSVDLGGGRFSVRLMGREVEPFIRNEEIGQLASRFSALPPVRAFLLAVQRQAGEAGDLVAEGRDMGTVVFPGAAAKFFLVASGEERARRRHAELLGRQGTAPALAALRAEIEERDRRDRERTLAPLKPAADARTVDTTGRTPDEVVEILLQEIQSRRI